MNWLEALILGIVQGLTEFLPVSSSGHLEIGAALLNVQVTNNLTFTVAVHVATVLSTIVVLRKEIMDLLRGLFKFEWNDQTQFIVKLIVSAIPVGIVGLFFKDVVEGFFSDSLMLVGSMLLLTAGLLTFAYYAKPRQKEKISFWDALIIGISQACAVLPGLSRSGTTISTGLLLGNKKDVVAKFSFLMVLAPILGECFLDLVKGDFSSEVSGIPTVSLVIGFLAAFVSGFIACSWMLNLVKKGKLIYFAIYCAIVGTAVLIFLG
ncbi:MAG: undecaprenyl-diphosphate phosphatase [Bacteroidales bacterium]|jgi:undecaprenyl-diphosphatase|nr:undecaprenyl-diphosphate phosphatase [Bacteroidales bacterium]